MSALLRGGLIEPDTGIDFAVGERDTVDHEFEVADAIFFDNQLFLTQTEESPEANAAAEPDLDLVSQRQVDAAGEGVCRELTASQPAGMAVLGWTGLEIEFALSVHAGILPDRCRE